MGAQIPTQSWNELQLTMNINMSAGQFNTHNAADQAPGVKQANTQKNNNSKFNILSVKKNSGGGGGSSSNNNNNQVKPFKIETNNGM